MINRIKWMFILGVLLMACAVQAKSKKPNIVLLLADDMGYGELGCYGQKIIKTPNLDALAAKGLRFTDFYAGCPVCSPSRGVLMTGIHAGKATIRGNKGFLPVNGKWDRVALQKSDITVAEMLKGAGYQTAFVGKWHLGVPEDTLTWACERGFDFAVQEQWGRKAEGGVFDERNHWVNNREKAIFYDYKEHDCLDEFRTDIIMDYLDEEYDSEKPLFLFMSYRSPHSHEFHLRETERYKEYGWPEIERRHASRITMLDEQIKRLLDKLEAMGELENTFILFASDNGPHGADGHDQNFFESSGEFRGYKRDVYEGGIRVPGIVYWPGKSRSGAVTDHQAAFCDVMSTFAEVAGIKPPKQTEGISFLPEVLGKPQKKHDFLYWEIQVIFNPPKGFRQAARMGDWKAVRYEADGITELYNLKNDPYEKKNVAKQYPEVAERMRTILHKSSAKSEHYPNAGGVVR